MSRLKSWLSYVNQFDPSFRQSLRPASSTEIDQLTQLAGPLPSSYVEFLKVMGQSLGNLKVQEANLTVIEATQFYQEGEDLPDPRFLYIGENDEDPYVGYFLDRDANPDDPPIYCFEPGTENHLEDFLCFESLVDLLYWATARQYAMKPFHNHGYFTPVGGIDWKTRQPADDVKKLAESEGFSMVSGTGSWMQIYEHSDGVLIASNIGGDRGILVEFAGVSGFFERISERLSKAVGVK